ncbi:MAG TPA: hypothetical protein VJ953_18520 [Saprospiraceae bacterium]|nr:hypothetical protein [Saprospiraceae bacterium]
MVGKFIRNYQREALYIGLAVVVFVVYRVFKTRRLRKLKLPENPDAPLPRAGFNPEAEAKMIHDELAGWNVALERRSETFEYILGYSENELRQVHNAYLKLYKDAKKKTLAELVRGEWLWTPGEYFGAATKRRNQILTRLRQMGAA